VTRETDAWNESFSHGRRNSHYTRPADFGHEMFRNLLTRTSRRCAKCARAERLLNHKKNGRTLLQAAEKENYEPKNI